MNAVNIPSFSDYRSWYLILIGLATLITNHVLDTDLMLGHILLLGGVILIGVGIFFLHSELTRVTQAKSQIETSPSGQESRNVQKLFEAILKYSPEQIYVKDKEGRHILISRGSGANIWKIWYHNPWEKFT